MSNASSSSSRAISCSCNSGTVWRNSNDGRVVAVVVIDVAAVKISGNVIDNGTSRD